MMNETLTIEQGMAGCRMSPGAEWATWAQSTWNIAICSGNHSLSQPPYARCESDICHLSTTTNSRIPRCISCCRGRRHGGDDVDDSMSQAGSTASTVPTVHQSTMAEVIGDDLPPALLEVTTALLYATSVLAGHHECHHRQSAASRSLSTPSGLLRLLPG